jgi:lysophospholipase L1-like esterase
MKNVVIIGDSLACPRPWIGLGQDETYASRIQRALGANAHVMNLAQGERSTRFYASEAFAKTYIERSNTDTLIMQLGIVDCAPRLMTLVERGIGFLCKKTRATNAIFKKYVSFKSKNRLFFTKYFPNIFVKKNEFEKNVKCIIKKYVEYGNANRIIIINIAYPGEHLTTRSYNVLKIIREYNDILEGIVSENIGHAYLIDLFKITRDNQALITPEDGHHITSSAHEIITKSILQIIDI